MYTLLTAVDQMSNTEIGYIVNKEYTIHIKCKENSTQITDRIETAF